MKLLVALLLGLALALSTTAQTQPARTSTVLVEVYRVVKDGALVNVCIENRMLGTTLSGKKPPVEVTDRRIFVRGLSGLADHERIRVTVQRDGAFSYGSKTYEQWVIPGTAPANSTP